MGDACTTSGVIDQKSHSLSIWEMGGSLGKGQKSVFTLFLLVFRSGAPFRDVFSISVALSLSAVLQLGNITPGGSEARVVGTNTMRKRNNKKKL